MIQQMHLQNLQALVCNSTTVLFCRGIYMSDVMTPTLHSSMSWAYHEPVAGHNVLVWVNGVHWVDVYVLAELRLQQQR